MPGIVLSVSLELAHLVLITTIRGTWLFLTKEEAEIKDPKLPIFCPLRSQEQNHMLGPGWWFSFSHDLGEGH